ncbi:L,D-transpeptidase-like protein [Dyadobacter jejuensis]|uniref:L,D-transpeptidase-like protein n=1 Tax=Dyadobacter jejuensis TaxID=1082580 RepID=A0A316AK26_9BACT|nr:L,D-transpeptidase family protein [Dyadobacter jejuensis]PWJ57200.1 L,D-transpeptidase-like protein [Dyadobacter jejuensis]
MKISNHQLFFRWAPLWILFGLAIIQSCKKDPHNMTKEELEQSLSEGKTHQSLLEYAALSGIDTSSYTTKGAPIFGLLEELAYGHKPELRYIAKTWPADTARLRDAAEELLKGQTVPKVMSWLEPRFSAYQHLREAYQNRLKAGDTQKANLIAASLNAYRWMNRQSQGAPRLVLVNIRGAYLKALNTDGKDELYMRTVVGKGATPTPTMDTYATSIVTHPYWNVPKSIALKEMLPKVLADESYLSKNNIQVIGESGEVVDPSDINWKKIDRKNSFPYRFRQDTGEDNSLGLLKVEIENPLAIYLHDTNARYLFGSDQRWRSHGCVRVQSPAELANFMAGHQLLQNDFFTEPDTTAQPPKWNKLKEKIPVFLLYLGADTDQNGRVVYMEDVYRKDDSEG